MLNKAIGTGSILSIKLIIVASIGGIPIYIPTGVAPLCSIISSTAANITYSSILNKLKIRL
jgi:hypothetical protein